jgi:hypothetical protein
LFILVPTTFLLIIYVKTASIPINHWRNEKGIKENKNPSLKWKGLVEPPEGICNYISFNE